MHQYRVTKYNPARRDVSGAYSIDEWTSHSDIGRSFGGITLSEEKYLAVENSYLEAAAAFLSEAQVRKLTVVGLESRTTAEKRLSENEVVLAKDVPAILRALLREEYWCRLEGASAFIHVGWDYYMYVGVPARCPNAERAAADVGLFVEQFRSPYAADVA
jgi:hypothetical protein